MLRISLAKIYGKNEKICENIRDKFLHTTKVDIQERQKLSRKCKNRTFWWKYLADVCEIFIHVCKFANLIRWGRKARIHGGQVENLRTRIDTENLGNIPAWENPREWDSSLYSLLSSRKVVLSGAEKCQHTSDTTSTTTYSQHLHHHGNASLMQACPWLSCVRGSRPQLAHCGDFHAGSRQRTHPRRGYRCVLGGSEILADVCEMFTSQK